MQAAAGTTWPEQARALAALVAHSLLYAGFFEDPTLWVTLAVLASLPTLANDPVTYDESATSHTG